MQPCSKFHLPRLDWSSCEVIVQQLSPGPGASPAVTGERGERGQESSLLSLDRRLWAALTPSSEGEPAMLLSRYSQLISVLTQHSYHRTTPQYHTTPHHTTPHHTTPHHTTPHTTEAERSEAETLANVSETIAGQPKQRPEKYLMR